MATVVEKWSSKGSRWTAHLEQDESGFTLREFKHGSPCGTAFRPWDYFKQNAPYAETKAAQIQAAKVWASYQVANGFDVQMSRIAV